MKTLTTKKQIAGAKRSLKSIASKFRRVDDNCKELLEKKGFEYVDLGTGTNQYICSKDIKEVIDPQGKKFLCFGTCNISKKTRTGIVVNVYRAFVKQIKL